MGRQERRQREAWEIWSSMDWTFQDPGFQRTQCFSTEQHRWFRSARSTCEWQNAETLYPSSVKKFKKSLSICTYRFNFQSLLAFSKRRTEVSWLKPEEKALSSWSFFFNTFTKNRSNKGYQTDCFRTTGKLDSWHLTGQAPSPRGATCYHPIIYGNHLMTWILSASGDLVHKWYGILQIICDKENKKKKGTGGQKRIETKAPCNNDNLVIPSKHGQVLLNFQGW